MQSAHPNAERSFFERPLVRAAIAAAVLIVLGGAAFAVERARGGSGDGNSGLVSVAGTPAPTAQSEAGLGALDENAPAIGKPAPDFALPDPSGRVVKLSDLRGQVVWVNFWATWCVPCKRELPDIQRLYDEKHDQGLEVLEVNWQEDGATASDFFEAHGLTLPILLDRNGQVFRQYKLQGLPDSFFIDRNGSIVAIYYGQLSLSKMREKLAAAGLP